MNFDLPREHQLLRKMYRDFAENEVKPIAAEIDEDERFPEETLQKMARYGFLGIPFPKEYGGQGGDNLAVILAMEEISRVCAATGTSFGASISLGASPIFDNGTEEQKRKYLPDLLSGKKLGAFGLTEPNAGTDSSAQETKAVLNGDHYILNGTKIFITNGGHADVFVIIAMTDKPKGNKGISAFIVEKSFHGFSVGKNEKKMGIHGSSTCELIMEDCIVPRENLLGKEGKGFGLAMRTLDSGRIGIAAQAVGIASGALEETIKYVGERKQFGRRLSQQQNTQFQLADMHTKLEAARLLVYSAASKKDLNRPYATDAAMAKLFASEMASDVTRRCLQLFGGYGYTREYPIERMMRDAKITEIYEGTSEVQKMVIAGAIGVK